MKIIKPDSEDQNPEGVKIFLAGSIEMGKAIDWQKDIPKYMSQFSDITFYNPRRDDWNNEWKQTLEDSNFVGQVDWELDKLEESDFIFFFFDPNTQSPISLIEFGMYVRCNPEKLIVCCPDGFWKKGNLQITGRKYGVKIIDDMQDAKDYLFNEIVIYYLQKEIKERNDN